MTAAELAAACRAAHREPFATQYDHRHLLELAADELDRESAEIATLRRVLDRLIAVAPGDQ